MADARWCSLAHGAVSMAMGFSFGLVSLLGGTVVTAGDYRGLFTLAVGLATVSSIVMWRVRGRLDSRTLGSLAAVVDAS